ncbi:DMT family transporter [Limobrevibacterium gyesilva]|uniref:EamA family transporter n=1 Tax=Limobrevibacterium gyesilva TaxID=2991712 RepID=A0AA41YNR4_9PROT|nr:EamA family transporter [Limobrevibacterium gyesilva]MCW3477276.1 EamA family transporter [Limobrevibacterium gyesilva]
MALSLSARQRVLFVILCIVWGTTWLAMKEGVAVVPPGVFGGLRWTVGGVVLLAWLRSRGESIRFPLRLTGRLLGVAVLMISFNNLVMLYGMRYVGSGLAAVLASALTPIGLLGFSVVAGQERYTHRQAGAIALGIGGLLLLFGPKAVAGRQDTAELLGALGVIVGCLAYCAGSVLARPLMRTLPPALMAATTNFMGGAILLVLSIAFEPGAGAALSGNWGITAWAAWLYLLLPGSLGATVIYFLLVRDWGASRTGTYAFVSPIIAVLLGSLLLGERMEPLDVAGMALMLAAAGLVLRRKP